MTIDWTVLADDDDEDSDEEAADDKDTNSAVDQEEEFDFCIDSVWNGVLQVWDDHTRQQRRERRRRLVGGAAAAHDDDDDEEDLDQPLFVTVPGGDDFYPVSLLELASACLENAIATLRTRSDARRFVDECAGPIIGTILDHDTNGLQTDEFANAVVALGLAVDLIALDLQIQNEEAQGTCALLSRILSIFIAVQAFYKESSQEQESGPQIRLQMILRFHTNGGFRSLAQHIEMRMETLRFADYYNIFSIVLLGAEDVLNLAYKDNAEYTKDLEQDVIRVGRAIMAWINQCIRHGDMKRVSTENLSSVLTRLRSCFDKLILRQRDATRHFYKFWRDLCRFLIMSTSLPVKLFGWDLLDQVIDASVKQRPPPASYWVEGAGVAFCNGRYDFEGFRTDDDQLLLDRPGEQAIVYVRTIPEDEPKAGDKLTIFRCAVISQKKWWFLSEADEEQPGTDRDVDYYQNKTKGTKDVRPPLTGWSVCRHYGADPPPTLRAEGFAMPEGEEHATLEHELVEWVIRNEVLEGIFGGTTFHREEVSRATKLIRFLSQMKQHQPTDTPLSVHASHMVLLSRFLKPSTADVCCVFPDQGEETIQSRQVDTRPPQSLPPQDPYSATPGEMFQYGNNRVAFETLGASTIPANGESIRGAPPKKCIFIGGDGPGILPYSDELQRVCHEMGYSVVKPSISRTYTGIGRGSLDRDIDDILELVQYLILHRQAKRICFIGHSTGCHDICHFLRHKLNSAVWEELRKRIGVSKEAIAGACLQAPVSIREQAASRNPEGHQKNLQLANNMCQAGAGQEFMPRATFWAPITAQRFLDLHAVGGLDEYFSSDLTDKQLAKRLQAVGDWPNLHMLVTVSGEDEFLPPSADPRSNMERLTKAMSKKRLGLAKGLYLPSGNHDLSECGELEIFLHNVKELLDLSAM